MAAAEREPSVTRSPLPPEAGRTSSREAHAEEGIWSRRNVQICWFSPSATALDGHTRTRVLLDDDAAHGDTQSLTCFTYSNFMSSWGGEGLQVSVSKNVHLKIYFVARKCRWVMP